MSIPVFFRLLYSSGIRTNEARLLPRENADLERGVLDIQYSKGHDQHYIVLHDSMLEIMRRYDTAIGEIVPGLSEIIKEQTQAGSEWMMPEVPADEEA